MALVPASLRYRTFAHPPCTRSYASEPCVYCARASVGIGCGVLAMGLLWEGALRDFPAEVVAINPDDGTLCLCFADAAEISRIQNNPKHAVSSLLAPGCP